MANVCMTQEHLSVVQQQQAARPATRGEPEGGDGVCLRMSKTMPSSVAWKRPLPTSSRIWGGWCEGKHEKKNAGQDQRPAKNDVLLGELARELGGAQRGGSNQTTIRHQHQEYSGWPLRWRGYQVEVEVLQEGFPQNRRNQAEWVPLRQARRQDQEP